VKDASENPPDFSSGDYNVQPDRVAQPNVLFLWRSGATGTRSKKNRYRNSRSGVKKKI
jgi:hypothetical protein